MQSGDPARVRLDLLDSRGVDPAQAWHSVGLRPAVQLLQARELGGVGRDDHLSALLVRDAPLGAVLVELASALHAKARLERAGLVVDAGVDHARAVAGLMRSHLGLALEHAHRRPRVPADQLARHRHAHDSASDNRDIARRGHRRALRLRRRHERKCSCSMCTGPSQARHAKRAVGDVSNVDIENAATSDSGASRAMARPRIPPPTTAMSHFLRRLRDLLIGGRHHPVACRV